jgi:hypothetical protein
MTQSRGQGRVHTSSEVKSDSAIRAIPGRPIMAFEIEEREVEKYPIALVKVLYPNLSISKGLDVYASELTKRFEHEEFWSDPCWSEPLDKAS